MSETKQAKTEKVIKWAEEYAKRMKYFILNDPNAKYNKRAVEQAKELMAFLCVYKYGAESYKQHALNWLIAVYNNS